MLQSPRNKHKETVRCSESYLSLDFEYHRSIWSCCQVPLATCMLYAWPCSKNSLPTCRVHGMCTAQYFNFLRIAPASSDMSASCYLYRHWSNESGFFSSPSNSLKKQVRHPRLIQAEAQSQSIVRKSSQVIIALWWHDL